MPIYHIYTDNFLKEFMVKHMVMNQKSLISMYLGGLLQNIRSQLLLHEYLTFSLQLCLYLLERFQVLNLYELCFLSGNIQ